MIAFLGPVYLIVHVRFSVWWYKSNGSASAIFRVLLMTGALKSMYSWDWSYDNRHRLALAYSMGQSDPQGRVKLSKSKKGAYSLFSCYFRFLYLRI
jgi:hypothetical protein